MNWLKRANDRSDFWKTFDETESALGNLFNDFDTVFGDTRYIDKDGNIILEVEAPGFNKENTSVELSEGILTVKGERKTNDDVGIRKLFKRIRVGVHEDVDAKLEDGILCLTIKQPKAVKQKIELK